MKIRKIYLFLSVALMGTLITSCYKDADYYTEDYDLTLTHYDNEFDFSTYKTFYLRDSVALASDYIVEGDANWKSFYKVGGASNQIRNEVRQQYISMGYTEVDSIKKADVAVNMLVTLSENTTTYYPGYWWGYPGYWYGYYPYYYKGGAKYWSGYWGGYWGGYYPWYGGGYSYTYKTGTLMLEMADGKALRSWIEYIQNAPDPSPEDPNAPELKFVWSAFVDGLQDDYSDMTRVLSGIDEAYKNSPYLKQN
jgi:hypothetical protein